MHSLDVIEDEKQSRTHSTTKNFVWVLRWRCRRSIFALQPRNPQVASRALPRQPWRCLGCCLDKAAPLALSPAPNRRCLSSETNLLALVSLGRVQVSWPAPGLSVVVEACSARPDGVSRTLLVRGCRPLCAYSRPRLARAASRFTGSRVFQKTCNNLAPPPDALT